MALNPWLITWQPMSERTKTSVRNLIAAILPRQTGEEQVKRVMRLLYATHCAEGGQLCISELVQYARKKWA
jgi:hypothetical protein